MSDKTDKAQVADKKPRKRGRRARLTYDAMIKMQAHFEHGTKSQRELARDNGIDVAMIGRYAKRDGWAPYGSKKAEALDRAADKIAERTVQSYAEVVEEVNERHLERLRRWQKGADWLYNDMMRRCMANYARNEIKFLQGIEPTKEDIARGFVTIPIDEKTKRLAVKLPEHMITTGGEAIVVERLTNSHDRLMQAERQILGLKEGALDKEDPTHGAKEIVRVLEEARQAYGDTMPAPPVLEQEKADD